jgi:hypothetical protein
MTPKVSVLMGVHNGARYLGEAIESILDQTWENFEFIVIDDGSTDNTHAILADYQRRDGRLQVHSQSRQGLAATLNTGLALARGEYVARMDADDKSVRDRLATQLALMEGRPDVGVCGAWVRFMDTINGEVLRYPVDDASLRCRLIFENPIAHPTVVLRRRIFVDAGLRYDTTFSYSQDYDLWTRASRLCHLANVPRTLVWYRQHSSQASQRHLDRQQAAAGRVRLRQIGLLNITGTPEEHDLHEAVSRVRFQPTFDFLDRAESWLQRLHTANQAAQAYPEPAFSAALAQQWGSVCLASVHLGLRVWLQWKRSDLRSRNPRSLVQAFKLLIKCIRRRPSLR